MQALIESLDFSVDQILDLKNASEKIFREMSKNHGLDPNVE